VIAGGGVVSGGGVGVRVGVGVGVGFRSGLGLVFGDSGDDSAGETDGAAGVGAGGSVGRGVGVFEVQPDINANERINMTGKYHFMLTSQSCFGDLHRH